ncbi:methyltransferase [Thermodesulfobacteriota bacterium]
MNTIVEKPDYGNWVSRKFVFIPLVLCLVFCGLIFIHPYFLILVIVLLVISLYFAYSRYLFSPKGKDIQTQIRDLVITNLVWNGEGVILDIGCGSGALAISVAKRYEKAQITGILGFASVHRGRTKLTD